MRPPSLCAVCRGWGAERICPACIARFAPARPRCERCALQVPPGTRTCGACVLAPPPFARTRAAVDYTHPWDGLIAHFKFHDALDLADALTRRLRDAVAQDVTDVAEPADAADRATLLLPMPLSAERLRERGYNQAWELTKRLGAALRLRSDASLLLRVKDTPHQLAFPPERRAANVRAAFAVEPRRRGELRDRRVALVDDVMTTGATAAEAARTLLQAGAQTVDVWVVARTPRPDDD